MKVCVVEFYTDFHDSHYVFGVYTDMPRAITAMVRAFCNGLGESNAVIRQFKVDEPEALTSIEYTFGHVSAMGWAERALGVNCITQIHDMTDREMYRRFMRFLDDSSAVR